MFIDESVISVQGGKGGDGNVSFFPGAKSGPSGGDGGRGGSVMVKGNRSKRDLYPYARKRRYEGEPGKRGENFHCSGADAPDLLLTVPIGTVFTDTATGDTFEVMDEEKEFCLVKGGIGGKGNAAFATSTRQAPRFAKP